MCHSEFGEPFLRSGQLKRSQQKVCWPITLFSNRDNQKQECEQDSKAANCHNKCSQWFRFCYSRRLLECKEKSTTAHSWKQINQLKLYFTKKIKISRVKWCPKIARSAVNHQLQNENAPKACKYERERENLEGLLPLGGLPKRLRGGERTE